VLAIAGFAACLAAAAWPGRWPAVWAGRWPRGILAIGAAVLGLVPGAAVVWPAAGGGLAPLPGEAPVRLALVVAAAVALVVVGAVHWWRWRLGFDRLQLTLVVACLGLGPAALRSLAEGAYLHDVGKVDIPITCSTSRAPSPRRSGAGSSSIRWSAPTSSGGLRRCAGPSRSSASTMSAPTATATPAASPAGGSRWPPGSSLWSTCGTRSPGTAPTGRPGRPTALCAICWPAGAPISTPTAWTPS
jgi:hypothetical protein